MKSSKPLGIACALLAVCLSAGVFAAGQEPAARGGRGVETAPLLTPVELERWFDSYVLLQAQETLKVTDAQFPRFLARLKALQETRRRNAQARRQILNGLGRTLRASPVDEAILREPLKSLRELDVRAADELRRAYEAVDEVLDPLQQARFRLFEEAVERRKIDLLVKARQRAGQAEKPAPPVIR